VYDATPLPPQRYGELGRTGKVVAPAGVNMRQAPDVTFPLVMTVPDGARVTLLARSPYSPWLKVDFNGIIGWLAIITLETQAVLEALPIDYNVPPPPEPTRIPGSFGNAFPDPNRGG
ncbi:MAG: SH3 domain-containing protein, partial [Anaerolineae bacterium]|nr:SH3 domain-containing protein [Anaerolineae bacterium]